MLLKPEDSVPDNQVHLLPGLWLADFGEPQQEYAHLGVVQVQAFLGVVIQDITDIH
jgi:hypothetical protein